MDVQVVRDLTAMVSAAPVVVWGFDRDGVCTVSAGGGLGALGFAEGEWVGRRLLDSGDPQLAPMVRRTLDGHDSDVDVRMPDGRVVASSYRTVRDEAGAVVGGLVVTLDVTHRRTREDEGRRGAVAAAISRDLAEHARRGTQAVAEALAAALAESFGDTVVVLRFDATGRVVPPAVVRARNAEVQEHAELVVPLFTSALGYSVSGPMLAGDTVYLDELPADLAATVTAGAGEAALEHLDTGPMAILPLRDGHVVGVAVLSRERGREPFDRHERDLLDDVAERAGLALANASLLETADALMQDRRRLLGHLVDAEEAERRRIAHDIHDDTIQVMAAVDLRLQLLRRRLAAAEGSEADVQVIDDLRASTTAASQRLRRLLFELLPPALEFAGVGAALGQLANDLFVETETECVISDELDEPPDEATAAVLFRIGKEALTNARKHAVASRVDVRLRRLEDEVVLEVCDDGVGFGESATDARWPHLGVHGMRDRAQAAGGKLSLRAGPRGGSEVELRLPWVSASRPADPTAADPTAADPTAADPAAAGPAR